MAVNNRLVARLLQWALRLWVKPFFGPPFSIAFQRRWLALAARVNRPAPAARHRSGHLGAVATETISAASGRQQRAILYLHGGAYCVGSPRTHRSITGRLALASQADVYAVDYRLAPQAPFPAALEDATGAYLQLVDNGYEPGQIAIAGDSAGAGLALATALSLRDRQRPLPACLLLLSPWLDLGNPGAAAVDDRIDAMLRWDNLQRAASLYAGTTSLRHPLISPLYADLQALPPMLVLAGSEEILAADARRLAASAAQAQLHIYPGMWHVFPLHAGLLAEADAAIAQMAAFASEHWQF